MFLKYSENGPCPLCSTIIIYMDLRLTDTTEKNPFLIHPMTRATHANEDWRSPCKTVKADELSRPAIHLNLHQICIHAKMSVTDSLFKLMT